MNTRWMTPLLAALVTIGLTAVPASAQTYTLTATLNGGQETPAPGINTGAFGDATVVVNLSTRTVSWTVNVFNLPSGVTAGHIHGGANGYSLDQPSSTSPCRQAPRMISPSREAPWTRRSRSGPIRAFARRTISSRQFWAGTRYVNVHSSVNTGGEIRGQLTLKLRP